MGTRLAASSAIEVDAWVSLPRQVLMCAAVSLLVASAMAADQKVSARSSDQLEEVIVTAQKRSERLQDVPVPVTALDANTLAERNQTRLQDYFAEVPGLNLSSAGNGQMSLSIRGLTSGGAGGGSPTVGVTIDDIPRGFNTAPFYSSSLYEDLDPSDLDRIEVLRGPQGTLYGAASIGGLIKFVTVDPSTAGFKGRVQAVVDDTGGSLGFGLRGAVNVPVSESFAIRASAFTRRDPGYVDNLASGQHDVNRAQVKGGRLSALWRPSASVSLKLAAMFQDTTADGSAEVDTPLGGLKQWRMPGTEGHSQKTGSYSGILNVGFGGFDLTAISAYGTFKFSHLNDWTALYGDKLSNFGVSLLDSIEAKKFSQEVRLASHANQMVDWLVGAFYTHENTPAHQSLLGNDYATGAGTGSLGELDFPTSFSEEALFGDLTFHLSDRFNAQVGGRLSTNRQVYDEVDVFPPDTFVTPTAHTKANASTYLFSPQFKISPDLMVYARFASGYRAGGPNAFVPGGINLPTSYKPDRDFSYDLGMKGDVWDHRLTFDVAAFHIDWKDIQIALDENGYLLHDNGGNAKSEGLELSVKARLTKGLTIAASATFDVAQLKDDLPAVAAARGLAGDRLPFSSRFSAHLSIEQDVALGGNWVGFFGGSLHYVGDRAGEFNSRNALATLLRQTLPTYTQLDLRAGARRDSWSASAFVNNLSDKRGLVGISRGGNATPDPTAVYVQPRTFGLSVTKEF